MQSDRVHSRQRGLGNLTLGQFMSAHVHATASCKRYCGVVAGADYHHVVVLFEFRSRGRKVMIRRISFSQTVFQ